MSRIAKNPCRAASVKPPRLVSRKVTPWPVQQVLDLHRALPARYRVAATIAAGCGLRQGEVFGLAVEDVEFLGRTLHVVRQVKMIGGKLIFALPKGRKTRDIPLPESVATELARHITAIPPLAITLPWETPGGQLTTARLLLYSRERKALDRRHFNAYVWRPRWRQQASSPPEPTACTRSGASTHRCCSTRARASGRSRSIWGTATPASPYAPTPICCRRVSREPGTSARSSTMRRCCIRRRWIRVTATPSGSSPRPTGPPGFARPPS